MKRKPATIADHRGQLREIATDLYAMGRRARNPERARKLGHAADIATNLYACDLWERTLNEPLEVPLEAAKVSDVATDPLTGLSVILGPVRDFASWSADNAADKSLRERLVAIEKHIAAAVALAA
jgi:hypothetical protein